MVANPVRVFTDSSGPVPVASSFSQTNRTWFVLNPSTVVVRVYAGVKLLGIYVR